MAPFLLSFKISAHQVLGIRKDPDGCLRPLRAPGAFLLLRGCTVSEKKTTCDNCDHFAYEVRTRLTLLWRYFNDMTESGCGITRYNVVSVEINKPGAMSRKEQKAKVLGRLIEGYYIEEDDLFAIENALYDVLKMAKELNGETMRSRSREVRDACN